MKKNYVFILFFFFFAAMAKANNIQLANILINGQNTVGQFSLINFDVSWDNSWRTVTNEANYDGAWVFAKFRKKTSNTWQHATIAATGMTMPAGSFIKTAADGKGVWIYRGSTGVDFTGNVNYTGAKLQWNYGADGVLNTDSVEIRLFALEMVYVPSGAFSLGTAGSEAGHFFAGGTNNAYNVASEAAITVANTPTNLFYASSGDALGPIPAAYPKGFAAVWFMKYECCQQQYTDFLNNLDAGRAANRYSSPITGSHPSYIAPAPERAMGSTSYLDHLAFADWAALRPFTEMEFEKAGRGVNQVPTPNEFAWGNTSIAPTTGVTNFGLATELANNGNANYQGSYGLQLRSGIYATASSNRTSSGGSFNGIMEMSGNVAEFAISVGSTAARSFTGLHGDGNVDLNGGADVANWPLTTAGLRGGNFTDAPGILCLSDRTYANASVAPTTRSGIYGFRLARTGE